jgi:hypothetical protein
MERENRPRMSPRPSPSHRRPLTRAWQCRCLNSRRQAGRGRPPSPTTGGLLYPNAAGTGCHVQDDVFPGLQGADGLRLHRQADRHRAPRLRGHARRFARTPFPARSIHRPVIRIEGLLSSVPSARGTPPQVAWRMVAPTGALERAKGFEPPAEAKPERKTGLAGSKPFARANT